MNMGNKLLSGPLRGSRPVKVHYSVACFIVLGVFFYKASSVNVLHKTARPMKQEPE